MNESKAIELFKQGKPLVFCGDKVLVKQIDYSWQEPEFWVEFKNNSSYRLNSAEVGRIKVAS